MKKKFMFDSWAEFRDEALTNVRGFIISMADFALAIVFGLLSLFRWLWCVIVRAVGNYPTAAVIVACALNLGTWAVTFAQCRSRMVCAEHQRDSLSYELARLTHGQDRGEYKVIGHDTIHVFNSYDR